MTKSIYFGFIFFALVLIACSTDKSDDNTAETNQPPKKKLIMAETSEMTAVMLQMHSFNESIRAEILNDGEIPNVPPFFERLYEADLTAGKERHESFEEDVDYFLAQQKNLLSVEKEERKPAFNSTVKACISCHKKSCTGPIPKIEKLFIP